MSSGLVCWIVEGWPGKTWRSGPGLQSKASFSALHFIAFLLLFLLFPPALVSRYKRQPLRVSSQLALPRGDLKLFVRPRRGHDVDLLCDFKRSEAEDRLEKSAGVASIPKAPPAGPFHASCIVAIVFVWPKAARSRTWQVVPSIPTTLTIPP